MMMPTLHLVAQTARTWREQAGYTDAMVAVCSLDDDPAACRLMKRYCTVTPRVHGEPEGGGAISQLGPFMMTW